MPAMTFIATANAVEEVGARRSSSTASPGPASSTSTPPRPRSRRGRGRSCRCTSRGARSTSTRLGALRDRHGLTVIEDAAHAMGTRWNGRADRHARQPRRVLVLRDEERHDRRGRRAGDRQPVHRAEVERLALHGLSLGAWQRYGDAGFRHFEVASPGIKANMTDLSASIGLHQLPRLEGWTARRAELAARYDALLADLPLQTPPPADPAGRHSWHLYSVLLEDDAAGPRHGRSTACSGGASASACTTAASTCTRTTRSPTDRARASPGRERHLRPDPQPPAQPGDDRRRPGRRRRGAGRVLTSGPALVS